MAFPLSTVFEGLKGLVHITVTADANGTPELVHFADEAGQACAHFAIHEWDTIGEHIANLLHTELEAATAPDTPAASPGGSITEPAPVTPTAPFLAPPADDTAPADAAAAPEETAPAAEETSA